MFHLTAWAFQHGQIIGESSKPQRPQAPAEPAENQISLAGTENDAVRWRMMAAIARKSVSAMLVSIGPWCVYYKDEKALLLKKMQNF